MENTTMKFAVGDWVFCEFTLQQITEITDERVTRVTDGSFSHSAYSLNQRCVPLTVRMKWIAYEYERVSTMLSKHGAAGLNFPEIHAWLVSEWSLACAAGDDDLLGERLRRLNQFKIDILCKQRIDSGYGFKLLRQPTTGEAV